MKYITQLFTIITLALMASCGDSKGKVIFEDHQELSPEYEWKKADMRTFELDIKDNSAPLELSIAFRYASGYYYPSIMLRITEVAPDGNKTIHDVEIPVRDEKGEFIGEKGYDIIDLEYLLDAKKTYPTHGIYTYTIEQTMPIETVDFAMEIGMVLREKSATK